KRKSRKVCRNRELQHEPRPQIVIGIDQLRVTRVNKNSANQQTSHPYDGAPEIQWTGVHHRGCCLRVAGLAPTFAKAADPEKNAARHSTQRPPPDTSALCSGSPKSASGSRCSLCRAPHPSRSPHPAKSLSLPLESWSSPQRSAPPPVFRPHRRSVP